MRENARRRPVFDDRGALGPRPDGLPARVGVIYGGPAPEHDVSILTGLQAVRALVGAPGVVGVHSLYWSKSGDWYEVQGALEAAAFVEGVPAGAAQLRLV